MKYNQENMIIPVDKINDLIHIQKKTKRDLMKLNIKTYDINAKAIGYVNCKYLRIGKFTIVEIVRDNKYYHGLSAKSHSDKEAAMTGIAIAFNKAFLSMTDDMHVCELHDIKECTLAV